jgi:hypothetical protein
MYSVMRASLIWLSVWPSPCAQVAVLRVLSQLGQVYVQRDACDPDPALCGLPPAQVAVLRVLSQLGQVYSVMRVRALADAVPFMSFAQVEHLIVTAVKHGYLQVTLQRRANLPIPLKETPRVHRPLHVMLGPRHWKWQ